MSLLTISVTSQQDQLACHFPGPPAFWLVCILWLSSNTVFFAWNFSLKPWIFRAGTGFALGSKPASRTTWTEFWLVLRRYKWHLASRLLRENAALIRNLRVQLCVISLLGRVVALKRAAVVSTQSWGSKRDQVTQHSSTRHRVLHQRHLVTTNSSQPFHPTTAHHNTEILQYTHIQAAANSHASPVNISLGNGYFPPKCASF